MAIGDRLRERRAKRKEEEITPAQEQETNIPIEQESDMVLKSPYGKSVYDNLTLTGDAQPQERSIYDALTLNPRISQDNKDIAKQDLGTIADGIISSLAPKTQSPDASREPEPDKSTSDNDKILTFSEFAGNPEEFIIKAAGLINDEKATAIIQHITYNTLEERYDTDIFTEPTIKGKLDVNAMKARRHLYDHIVYDSTKERDFASELDTNEDVAVYVKLPSSFYISTPVGRYNPDWAIAFYEGTVKHIYFVAETKGSLDSFKLNHITPIEQAKIDCAREHFKAISGDNVVYDVVDSYQALLEKVMR